MQNYLHKYYNVVNDYYSGVYTYISNSFPSGDLRKYSLQTATPPPKSPLTIAAFKSSTCHYGRSILP